MKRIIVFWLVLLLPIFVLAKEYQSSNINIKLDINDDYIVLTRENLKDNVNLEKLNVTEEQMIKIMKYANIYFDILKDDISFEILIVVPDTSVPIKELTGINQELLNSFKDEAAKKVKANSSSIYNGKYDYIVVDYYDEDSKYYIVNYYTVVNNKGYNIQLQKRNPINENDKTDLRIIVDSVTFIKQDNVKKKENDIKENDIKENDKDFNYMHIVYGVIIGTIAGLVTYFIISKK